MRIPIEELEDFLHAIICEVGHDWLLTSGPSNQKNQAADVIHLLEIIWRLLRLQKIDEWNNAMSWGGEKKKEKMDLMPVLLQWDEANDSWWPTIVITLISYPLVPFYSDFEPRSNPIKYSISGLES